MADFSITYAVSVNLFGTERSTTWGQGEFPYTMTWGTATWGYGFTIPIDVQKLVDGAITPTWDQSQILVEKLVADSVTPSWDTDIERLSQGNWNIVFVSDTTDAEERDVATWTSAAAATTTWTSQAAGSTTWT